MNLWFSRRNWEVGFVRVVWEKLRVVMFDFDWWQEIRSTSTISVRFGVFEELWEQVKEFAKMADLMIRCPL